MKVAAKILVSIVFTWSFALSALAQKNKVNFYLKEEIQKNWNQNGLINLIAKGDIEFIHEFVLANKGIFKFSKTNICALSLPAQSVENFVNHPSVYQTEFFIENPQVLSDPMLVNNNVVFAHEGTGNLKVPYKGKDVVVGIVDSGIELAHPDFKKPNGETRVKFLWDQNVSNIPSRIPADYGYGIEWNENDINLGICSHNDQFNHFGHGTNVAGTAVGNGKAVGNYEGVASEADIIVVATNLNASFWTSTVADAIDFIFKKADILGKPAVVNLSVGTYTGSHDGKDLAAQLIKLMLLEKNGRSVVCAAGNTGDLTMHLGYSATSDTTFTWFKNNPNAFSGGSNLRIDMWLDSADLANFNFSIGADRIDSVFSKRGQLPFKNALTSLYNYQVDTLFSYSGNKIARVITNVYYASSGAVVQIFIPSPDSANYKFRLNITGSGRFDVWSNSYIGTNDMVYTNLPNDIQFPDIVKYRSPDNLSTLVSSWACLPEVITVGNYVNQNVYVDYLGNNQNMGLIAGNIYSKSSLGPTRDNVLKPDITASGEVTFATSHFATVAAMISTQPNKVAPGGLHNRNGGTSTASPVVAGTVALLLELCSELNAGQIKDIITGSAKSDNFTINVPNNIWGYGKVDAYEALSSIAPTVSLSESGNKSICEGDSIMLELSNNFEQYYWNTGSFNSQISVHQTNNFNVIVRDENGCKAYSDTLNLIVNPTPDLGFIAGPLSASTNEVVTYNSVQNSNFNYNWEISGGSIIGFNGQPNILIKWDNVDAGEVKLRVSNNFGCYDSDSLEVNVNMVGWSENQQNDDIYLYPNPSSNNLSISFKNNFEEFDYVIFNHLGKTVQNGKVNNIYTAVNIESLSNGNYKLMLMNTNKRKVIPFVKM